MKILVVVVTVVVMLAVIIASTGLHSWEYQKSVDGIRYSRVRSEDHPSHGRITIGRLADPVEIDGRIYRDWLHRREDGTIVGGLLAEDTIVGDLNIPAGTWVSFTADNDLRACHFPKDQDIQGYRCRGTGGGGKGAVKQFVARIVAGHAPDNLSGTVDFNKLNRAMATSRPACRDGGGPARSDRRASSRVLKSE